MCGIAGIVASASRAASRLEPSVMRMIDALGHRGPDDWGTVAVYGEELIERSMTYPDGNLISSEPKLHECSVVLGHRRLAIIDLSSNAHQPMATPDGRFWITFNGEIYNYAELRCLVEANGAILRSNSDTEVLLLQFAQQGPACLQTLRGMFAFAIWDRQRHELFLARDRFGMKPVYYAWAPGGVFVFASELKALLASGWLSAEFDEQAEVSFLRRGCIQAPKTIYREIKVLEPGQWARWDGKEFSIETYWSFAEAIANAQSCRSGDYASAEAVQEIRRALNNTAAAHLVSDVPLGLLLSGGLDSTAVLAAIRESYTGPLKTFTVTSADSRSHERSLARKAASYYGADHTEIEITKDDFVADLNGFFSAMDQPTSDGYNAYFVSKCVRDAGIKAALSGLGGDEFLGGYKSFVDVPRLGSLLRVTEEVPWLLPLASRLAERFPERRAAKMAHLIRGVPHNLQTLWSGYRALFTDEQIREMGLTPQTNNRSEKNYASIPNPFWEIACLEAERFMTPQLLRDSDVFAMCHGIELRMPFVDHVFLSSVLNAGCWPRNAAPSYKAALFANMKTFLPSDFLGRRKTGFVLPFDSWLRDAVANDISEIGGDLCSRLSRACYRPYLEGFRRGKVHWSRIWSLYVLERFKGKN